MIGLAVAASAEQDPHVAVSEFSLGPVQPDRDPRTMLRRHLIRRSCELLDDAARRRHEAFAGGRWEPWRDTVRTKVRDALGEMCNMAAGNFKAKINGMADACMLSIPTVVSGRDYQIHSLAAGERFEVAVTLEGLPIWVVLDLHS